MGHSVFSATKHFTEWIFCYIRNTAKLRIDFYAIWSRAEKLSVPQTEQQREQADRVYTLFLVRTNLTARNITFISGGLCLKMILLRQRGPIHAGCLMFKELTY